jgi:hypothetical protein
MLRTQIIADQKGIPMGVFIPMKIWEDVKVQYPDIENYDEDMPQWEKDFIDKRLEIIKQHPQRLQPVNTLFERL